MNNNTFKSSLAVAAAALSFAACATNRPAERTAYNNHSTADERARAAETASADDKNAKPGNKGVGASASVGGDASGISASVGGQAGSHAGAAVGTIDSHGASAAASNADGKGVAATTANGGAVINDTGSAKASKEDMKESDKGIAAGAKIDAKTGLKYSPRAQKEAILDDLYARWGGGDTARDMKEKSRSSSEDLGNEVKEKVAPVINGADRMAFTTKCEAAGKGNKPMFTDARTKKFFAQKDVMAKCAEVVRLNQEIKADDAAPAPTP